MAKLYFCYGTVSSAKTANLLLVAHTYRQQGKKILLLKPSVDTRTSNIYSRAGLETTPDIIVDQKDNLLFLDVNEVSCILCDEAQFFTKQQIKDLRYIATFKNIPVICYGLRTDYKGNLFDGSYMLCCIADLIKEIKTTCNYCNKKSIMNLKISKDGTPIYNDKMIIDTGFDDKYLPVCYKHYVGSSNVVDHFSKTID